ncbi:hypothetical protein C8F04DRAFT_946494 [Mycena alexandri]|uniref:Zn(2)-C6 fungal-type domain-containing protein n=1 Tax=Mycena alexandri TaxID=1745969 RepID=A0AAD6T921_9AGAR|nr:hypothetical protein C8F04DRAFT_946494 [Mycena alexandri]
MNFNQEQASNLPATTSRKTKHLQRGTACFNCKRRKMRCDGAHPICGQCERANRSDDCEYTNGQKRARAEILEESISRTESRIYELEHPHQNLNQFKVPLHQPYQPDRQRTPESTRHQSWAVSDEPPMDMVEKLIDFFLPFSSEVGFFLNASRFRHSALIRHSIGHPSRPSPAVLAAVYLWGLRLSKQPFLTSQEPIFLSRALKLVTKGLSGIHPQKVIHNLQAEILISYYFFASGRFLEGKYHTAAAVSLGLGSSIHMVRSANSTSLGLLQPARDAVEEGERIHACWNAVILDKTWAVVLSEAPNLDHQHESCAVDTPWPLEMDDYEQGEFSPTARYSNTFHKFVNCVPTSDTGMSSIALLSKATILWQRADGLSRQWRPDMLRDQSITFQTSFCALDNLIDTFRGALVPLNRIAHPTPAMARTLIVAHSIAHAATIRLHSVVPLISDINARRKRLTAARAVLEIVVAAAPLHFDFINPIMGVRPSALIPATIF